MAFDFGETRIGVAVGNTTVKIAHPLKVITGSDKFEKLDKIDILIKQWLPCLLVVGMPSQIADKAVLLACVNKFANRLRHRFNLPVEFINEDFTSSVASIWLNEQSCYGVSQKPVLDALSAKAILETYFETVQ